MRRQDHQAPFIRSIGLFGRALFEQQTNLPET